MNLKPNTYAELNHALRVRVNAHGRVTPRGHRCTVTAEQAVDRLSQMLKDPNEKGFRAVLFNRTYMRKATMSTAVHTLADVIMLMDDKVEHKRAERIAHAGVQQTIEVLDDWLRTYVVEY